MVEFFPLPHPTCCRASSSILGNYWEQTVIKPPWQDPLFCGWTISQLQSQNCCDLGPAILASHHRLHRAMEKTLSHQGWDYILPQWVFTLSSKLWHWQILSNKMWGQRSGLHVSMSWLRVYIALPIRGNMRWKEAKNQAAKILVLLGMSRNN